jgi:hypothetical protein
MEEEELQIMFKRKKKRKVIEFDHAYEDFQGLAAAVTLTPDWYKKSQRWVEIPEGEPNLGMQKWPGLKHCLPFLEALSIGYYILLDQDVIVTRDENGLTLRWENGEQIPNREMMSPVEYRPPHVTDPLQGPNGYGEEYYHFHFFMHLSIRPPKGYSMIITHPFNRFELPFITMTGIVDDYAMPGANASFFLKNGFEGVIPKGTPIAQVIPFKREDWKAVRNRGLWSYSRSELRSTDELLEGHYRKNIWKKKSFK